jgi:hypothetical protein
MNMNRLVALGKKSGQKSRFRRICIKLPPFSGGMKSSLPQVARLALRCG